MAKVMTTLLLATLLTGCFQAQRAPACNNTGIQGCKDKPSEIQPPDPELRRARSGEGSPPRSSQPQVSEAAPGNYLEGMSIPGPNHSMSVWPQVDCVRSVLRTCHRTSWPGSKPGKPREQLFADGIFSSDGSQTARLRLV